MKVLHVTGVYPSPENHQAGSFIYSQVESLRKAGVECDVCVLEGSGIKKYITGISNVRKAISKNNYDLIHAHYMYSGWSARLATTLPVVVSYMGSDVWSKYEFGGTRNTSSKLLHEWFAGLLVLTTKGSLAKSKSLADSLPKGRVEVVPNGVNMEIFKPRAVDRSELNLSERNKYILFSSTAEQSTRRFYKRYDVAKDAAEILKKRMPESELIWIEKKPPELVAKYLNAVDCLLLTSQNEGSPNIVKEALACGLPVLGTDVGDVAERLDGIDLCYVIERNPQIIADKLYELLSENRRSANSREKVGNLSIEKVAKKINAIYEKAIG